MTEAKASRRRRRATSGPVNIPVQLVEWFAGQRLVATNRATTPWAALAYPDNLFVGERWRAWKAENPGKAPPVGWEWLDDPTSPRHQHPLWMLEMARKVLEARPRG